MNKLWVTILLIACGLIAAPAVQADIAGFGDGTSWQLNANVEAGNAGMPVFLEVGTPDGVFEELQLTDPNNNEAASAFHTTVQDVTNFTAAFDYQFLGGSDTPADGLAFILHNDTRGEFALGDSGGALGYGGGPLITPSVALQFNLYKWNTVGVNVNNSGNTGGYVRPGGVDLLSGNLIRATIDYDGTTATLYLQDLVTGAVYTESEVANIPLGVGGLNTAYVGFSGATGGQNADQRVSGFSYQQAATLNWGESGGAWNSGQWTTGVPPATDAGPPTAADRAVLLASNPDIVSVGAGPNVALSLAVNGGGIDIGNSQTLAIGTSANFAALTSLNLQADATLTALTLQAAPTVTMADGAKIGVGSGSISGVTAAGSAVFDVADHLSIATYTGVAGQNLVKQGGGGLDVATFAKAVPNILAQGGTVLDRGAGSAPKVTIDGGKYSLSDDFSTAGTGNALFERYWGDDNYAYGTSLIEPLSLAPARGLFRYSTPDAYGEVTTDTDLNFAENGLRDRARTASGQADPAFDGDRFGSVFHGSLTIVPPGTGNGTQLEAGPVTFGVDADDGVTLYIDGKLVAANNYLGGIGDYNRAWGAINLGVGDHEIVIGQWEGEWGDGLQAKFAQGDLTERFQGGPTGQIDTPYWDSMTFINPGQAAQAGMWTSYASLAARASLAGKTVEVIQGGGLEMITQGRANAGNLVLANGVLETSGTRDGMRFESTTITNTADSVGIKALVPTMTDVVTHAAKGAKVPATISIEGSAPVIMDKTNVGLAGDTIEVQGELKMYGDGPWGGASQINLRGGTASFYNTYQAGGVSGLSEKYYELNYGQGWVDPLGPGYGYMTLAPDAWGVYDDNTNLDFGDNVLPARAAAADNPIPVNQFGNPADGGNPDDPNRNQYGAVFHGTLRVYAPGDQEKPTDGLEEGWVTFATNSDDGNKLFVDGEMVTGFNDLHGRGVWDDRWGSVYLTAGDHQVYLGMWEDGGGDSVSMKYSQGKLDTYTRWGTDDQVMEGDGTVRCGIDDRWTDWNAMTYVNPGAAGQTGMWSSETTVTPFDLSGKTVVVTDGGTLNPLTFGHVDVAHLVLENGVITTQGPSGRSPTTVAIGDTTITDGATSVGFDTDVPTDPGVITHAGVDPAPATISSEGSAPLVITETNVNLDADTWQVRAGVLDMLGVPAWGGSTNGRLTGGTMILRGLAVPGTPGTDGPGLVFGAITQTGGPLDKTTPNPENRDPDPNGPSASETAAFPPWADNTTLVYTGEMYLDGMTNFTEDIDDEVFLVIDGVELLDDTVWNSRTSGTITRAAGWYEFELRMFNGGGGAGIVSSPGFGYDPSGTGTSYSPPQNSPYQADLFRSDGLDRFDALNLTTHSILVDGSATLEGADATSIDLGPLTMANNGMLTTTDVPVTFTGGAKAPDTEIANGAVEVGFNPQSSMDVGVIDGRGVGATIVKFGNGAPLVLNKVNVGLLGSRFETREGVLNFVPAHVEGEDDANPIGEASLLLTGGETLLSARQTNDTYTYDTAVEVDGNATLTAGQGAGAPGQANIIVGSPAKENAMLLTSGNVALQAQNDYTLTVAGGVSGPGALSAPAGPVTLASTVGVGGMSIVGGDLTASQGATTVNLDASSGSLTLGGNLNVTDGVVSGGTFSGMDPGENAMVVSNSLKIADVTYSIADAPKATFTAQGTDLTTAAKLSLSGGIMTLDAGSVATQNQLTGVDVGGPARAGSIEAYAGNEIHVIGGGADMWDHNNRMHFAYYNQQFDSTADDIDIIAYTDYHQPEPAGSAEDDWTKGGVGIFDGTVAATDYAFMAVSGTQTVVAQGWSGGNVDQRWGENPAEPEWLRVRYTVDDPNNPGHNLMEWLSSNDDISVGVANVNWNRTYSQSDFNFDTTTAETLYVGMAVTAHNDERLQRTSFEEIYINGTQIVTTVAYAPINADYVDVEVTANSELAAAIDATLGDLDVMPTASAVTHSGAPFSYGVVTTAAATTAINGEWSVRDSLNIGDSAKGGIGTLTVDTGGLDKSVEFGSAAEVNIDIGLTNDNIVLPRGSLDLDGELNLNVTGDILPAAAKRPYGAQTRTIIEATGADNSEIVGQFAVEPSIGDHLGRGIFVDLLGSGVVTTNATVKADLYQAQKGDANGDHVIDTGDMMLVFGNWTLLPPPDHVPRDWPEGNFSFFPPGDANTTIETGDMMEVFGNWTLPVEDAGDAKDGDPQIADLLYYPATGEVQLDPSEAAGEVITIFRLMNEAGEPDFNAPGVANFPWPLPDFLAVDTPLEIANTDLSGSGISDVWSLGAIFPTGLDQDQLEAFLTVATYVGSRGTGVHRLDLIVIPEPGTVVMLLTGALGLLLLALRRRSA